MSTVDIIVAVAIIALLAAGFWWTRGGGGVPGGISDPARNQLTKYTRLGNTGWDPDARPEPVADPTDHDPAAAPPPDPEADEAAWARERERYRQKNPD